MNLFRYPLQQNRLIVVRPHPLMSFYTNPASCMSAAVFDPKMKRAALTHTMNPYIGKKIVKMDCDCSPEDYLKELPVMAQVKHAFIEKHFDHITEYHSCDKAMYTDASIRFLWHRFGNPESAVYKLIGGSKDQTVRRNIIPFDEKVAKDLKTLLDESESKNKAPDYLSINELNVLSALGNTVRLGLNLGYADIHGNGVRVFDFFPKTGKIVYSPKTRIRNQILFENDKSMKTIIGEVVRRLSVPAILRPLF